MGYGYSRYSGSAPASPSAAPVADVLSDGRFFASWTCTASPSRRDVAGREARCYFSGGSRREVAGQRRYLWRIPARRGTAARAAIDDAADRLPCVSYREVHPQLREAVATARRLRRKGEPRGRATRARPPASMTCTHELRPFSLEPARSHARARVPARLRARGCARPSAPGVPSREHPASVERAGRTVSGMSRNFRALSALYRWFLPLSNLPVGLISLIQIQV